MYTEGIRKIFIPVNARDLKTAFVQATEVGYKALSWNNIIFIRADDFGWIATCFTLDDFKTQ